MNDLGINEQMLPCGSDIREFMEDMQVSQELSTWRHMSFNAVGERIEPGDSPGSWKVRCCTALRNILSLLRRIVCCSSQVSWCDEQVTTDEVIGWMAATFPGTNRIYIRKGESVTIDLTIDSTDAQVADAVGRDTGFYFTFEEKKVEVYIDSEDEPAIQRQAACTHTHMRARARAPHTHT